VVDDGDNDCTISSPLYSSAFGAMISSSFLVSGIKPCSAILSVPCSNLSAKSNAFAPASGFTIEVAPAAKSKSGLATTLLIKATESATVSSMN